MTPGENKLRAALRQTAGEIADDPPPLDLSRAPASRPRAHRAPANRQRAHRDHASRRWISWAAPLAAAAVVVALIAGSLAVVRGGPAPRTTSTPSSPARVPPYYVALAAPGGSADVYDGNATVAQVRATATGAVLARVLPPKPYVSFSGVSAAADDRTFVLSAQGTTHPALTEQQLRKEYPRGFVPAARFFLLRIDPGSRERASLRALPAGFLPARATLSAMALSPDGAFLAAEIAPGPAIGPLSHLYVFNLATGTSRTWSYQTRNGPSAPAGLGYGGVNAGALSWTADGKRLAFVGPGRPAQGPSAVRLLDVTVPGSDLGANSRPIATLPPGDKAGELSWRAAIVTPDGQAAVIVEELATDGAPIRVRDRLLKVSAATGRVTVLNDLNVLAGYQYEQIMYASPDGSTLVVSGARRGDTAGILRGDRYTPLPWSRNIAIAAW
jgi:hypothetical protein